MKIAVIGTGNVGGTLGVRFAKNGHVVAFCSRNPTSDKVRKLLKEAGSKATAADAAVSVPNAEVVVLATPWDATLEIVRSLGNVSGKIIIDATNPLSNDLTGLTVTQRSSAAELIAEAAEGARVVKAFNTINFGTMEDPSYGDTNADGFLCGDDEEAKKTVTGLLEELGIEPVDIGPLYTARFLENLALLWVHSAFKQKWGTDFAFKVIRR
jgi:NADPH-dependent F420 reductase